MSDTAKWYVIHTYSSYENKVSTSIETVVENQSLQDLIQVIKVPVEKYEEIKDDGSVREMERKKFPGYVYVKMILTDDSWYVIRNIRGVTGFVGPGSKPVPLPDHEVEQLNLENDDSEDVIVEVNYAVGDSVQIISGKIKDTIGVVDEIDLENKIVKVTVPFFGRESQVELELAQVVIV